MTYFAAIAKNTNTNELEIVGLGASKSAASRVANRRVQDCYGNRVPYFGEIHLCEFESWRDAREYVEVANRH